MRSPGCVPWIAVLRTVHHNHELEVSFSPEKKNVFQAKFTVAPRATVDWKILRGYAQESHRGLCQSHDTMVRRILAWLNITPCMVKKKKRKKPQVKNNQIVTMQMCQSGARHRYDSTLKWTWQLLRRGEMEKEGKNLEENTKTRQVGLGEALSNPTRQVCNVVVHLWGTYGLWCNCCIVWHVLPASYKCF